MSSAHRSIIASANALFRMAESRRPAGSRLLNDPWAGLLAEKHPLLETLRYARFGVPWLGRLVADMQVAHCVRHRTIDTLILRAVRRGGYQQVVVVGAGYDMRSARFAADLQGVLWIEVDQEALLERKQQVLEHSGMGQAPPGLPGSGFFRRRPLIPGLSDPESPGPSGPRRSGPEEVEEGLVRGWAERIWRRSATLGASLRGRTERARVQVERVGLDLIHERLARALRDTDFDPREPALFVLEGLIHYLPMDRVEALLEDITRGSGRRRVLLSFIRTDVYRAGRRRLEGLLTLLGEVPQLHLRPEELQMLCARHGLGHLERWTLAEQVTAFVPLARDRCPELGQDVAQVETLRW